MVSTAIVVLSCKLGSTKEVIKEVKKVSGIDEIKEVIGIYDIILRVTANSVDELKEIVTKKIKKSNKIFSSLTMITVNKEMLRTQKF